MVRSSNRGLRGLRAGGTCAALALVSLCTPALGAPPRDDDVDFALKLAQRGYPTLAQAEIDLMLVNATPERREKAEFTRCELLRRAALQAAARPDSPPADVRAQFAAARTAFEAFLKNFRSGARVADAEFANANLLKDFGYFLHKRMSEFSDQAQVQKEAESAFDESIRLLRIVRDREHQKVKASNEEDEGAAQLRNVAWYYLCVAMYERALLYPVGDALRVQGLTRAYDEELYPFFEETEGAIPGYYACLYMGKVYFERARLKDGWDADDLRSAREWFSISVDSCDLDGAAGWPALVNVILESARDYGKMCNEVGSVGGENYPQIFVNRMTSLETKLPAARTQRAGLEAFIEKARAQALLGQYARAVSDLASVSDSAQKMDPAVGRGVDFMARQALNELIAAIPPGSKFQVSPATLFRAGEGSIQARNPGQAIRAFQRVLASLDAESDPARRKAQMDEYHTTSWLNIAYCYFELERHREAFLAADQPVQKYLLDRRTDEDAEIQKCVSLRLNMLKQIAASSGDAAARADVDRERALITEKFPWIEGENISYEQAVTEMDRAGRLMRQGDKEGAAAAFAKAIELLGRLTPKESLYHRAQSRIGECLVLSEKPDEGRKHLESFLQKNAEFFADPNTPPARRQPQGWAVFWLATAYSDMKQPAKVIDVLAEFENKFKGASLENSIPRVRYLRIRSMDAAGRLADAEKEILALRNDSPDSPWTAPAALAVATALYNGSDKIVETDPAGARAMLGRSADLFDFWLAGTPDAVADNFVWVGTVNQKAGRFDRASEALAKALAMEEAAGKSDKADTIRANLVGLLIDQEKYAEALPRLEYLFIKPQADLTVLRAFFAALDFRHPSIDLGVHKEGLKKALQGIVARASLQPGGAPAKEKAERIIQAADPNIEQLLATYDDLGPAGRAALAHGCAMGTLASSNALSPAVRTSTFELVKRTPDLMSHIARCHEATAARIDSGITAINLLQMLIDSAPSTDPEVRVDGHRYTARWFEWKYRLMGVYRTLGISLNQDRPLQTVCDLYKSMTTLGEIQMAETQRPGFAKKFNALRDEVETALRRLGKTGGCQ